MRKELSQEEIDALFSAAQPGQKAEGAATKKNVEKCDLGKAKTLSAAQGLVLNTLHESFARRASDSLGTYLRTGCELNLVAAEQLRYSEFLGRVPEMSYLASLRMLPIDAGALLLMDMSLVFPIVDLALGGSGSDPTEPRNTTEIEDQIIEAAISLMARDLQNAWAPVVSFDIQFDQRQPLSQSHAMMLPNERILSLNFEIRLLDLRGAINIILPAVVANALLRKLAVQGSLGERMPSRNTRRKTRESLLDALETKLDPMVEPGLDVRLFVTELPRQVLQHPQIVDRVDVASDRLSQRPHPRPADRVAREQRRRRPRLVEIFDDR